MYIVQYLYQGQSPKGKEAQLRQWHSSAKPFLFRGNAIKELRRLSHYHIARIIDEKGNAIHLES